MASEEDLVRIRAAAVQAALEGNTKQAAGWMAIGKTIEESQKEKDKPKGKR